MNMNAIELAGACAIELNVCVWEDLLHKCYWYTGFQKESG